MTNPFGISISDSHDDATSSCKDLAVLIAEKQRVPTRRLVVVTCFWMQGRVGPDSIVHRAALPENGSRHVGEPSGVASSHPRLVLMGLVISQVRSHGPNAHNPVGLGLIGEWQQRQ